MSPRKLLSVWVGLLYLMLAAPAWAEDGHDAATGTATQFVRLSRTEDGELRSLDTAITRYTLPGKLGDDITVDLIGVVHVGEKAYYEQLNKEFEQYDSLLYELVAPEGTVVSERENSNNPLASMQTGLKDLLELEFQLDHIDYGRDNFVHADMSPEEFAESMERRGENLWTMFFRMMGQGILQQSRERSENSEMDLFTALFDDDRSTSLKRLMAEQFEDLDLAMAAFEGPDGSTLIAERNKVALQVMADQIAAGKKRIGIFYGAGHLPDMEQRLVKEFAGQYQDQHWLTAWDLRSREERAAPEEDAEESAEQESEEPKDLPSRLEI